MEGRLGRNPFGTPIVNREGQAWDFMKNHWTPKEQPRVPVEPRIIFSAICHVATTVFHGPSK